VPQRRCGQTQSGHSVASAGRQVFKSAMSMFSSKAHPESQGAAAAEDLSAETPQEPAPQSCPSRPVAEPEKCCSEPLLLRWPEPALVHALQLGSLAGSAEDGRAAASRLLVRSPGYAFKKQKQPSQAPFYELAHVEALAQPSRGGQHSNIGAQIFQEEQPVPGPLPSYFIMNFQMPDEVPSLCGSTKSGRSSLALYFRIRPETQAAAAADPSDPALRLLVRYCTQARLQRRLQEKLKVVCQVENIAESKELSQLDSFNGTPALVTKPGTLCWGQHYLEMDVDLGQCTYWIRKGMHQMRNLLKLMELRVAILIQGDGEDELPERAWGIALLHHVDIDGLLKRSP